MNRLVLFVTVILISLGLFITAQAQNQTVANGSTTTAVNFAGTGCTYNWVNNNSTIGLPASGTGNIPSFTAINTGPTITTATITATPIATGYAYIANATSQNPTLHYTNTVTVINTATNQIVKTITVGLGPIGVSISPDQSKVYVANSIDRTISVISTATNTVIATINVGSYPVSIVVSPDGSKVYVSNFSGFSISIIDAATNMVIGSLPVNISPLYLAITPDGNQLYVSNYNHSNTVSVIDLVKKSVIANINVGNEPVCIGITPDGSRVYVSNDESNTVSVIDAATNAVIKTVSVGRYPQGIVITPDGSRVYVKNSSDGTLSVISTSSNNIVSTIQGIGQGQWGLSISPDGSLIYATNATTKTVSVVSTSNNILLATINVDDYPNSLGNFVTGGTGCQSTSFTITVNPTPKPVITVTGSLAALNTVYGTPSASTSFTVSGNNLKTGITITPPLNFEVSTDNTTFADTLTLSTGGNFAATTLYVRIKATAPAGSYSGDFLLTSVNAADVKIAVIATVVPAKLNVMAKDTFKTAGSLNPIFRVNYNGFVNHDNPSQLNTKPQVSTLATTNSTAGQYPIIVGGASSPNYTFNYLPGVLTIYPVSLNSIIPTAFTPNGDGINDLWEIKYLQSYHNCVVEVFNRYGQKVYRSFGYSKAWDGTYNAHPLPPGTYYYVINMDSARRPLSGSVVIIK